jgi:hypothetical protein
VQRVVDIVKASTPAGARLVAVMDGIADACLAGFEVVGGWASMASLMPNGWFRVGPSSGDIRDANSWAFEPFDAVVFIEVIEHIPPADCVAAFRI